MKAQKIIVVETIQMSMNERKLNAKWIKETNQWKLKRKRDGVEGIVIDWCLAGNGNLSVFCVIRKSKREYIMKFSKEWNLMWYT